MDIRKYDIVQADLGNITIGSEQGGKRPVLVVQNDRGNFFSTTTIVIPLSSKIKSLHQPTHTLIHKSNDTGLKTDSVLLGNNIKKGVIHTYTLVVLYKDTGIDQSDDMNKALSARINIIDIRSKNPYDYDKTSLAYNIINNGIRPIFLRYSLKR